LLLFGGLIGDGSAKIPPLAALCSTVGMTTLFGRTGGRILRLRFAPLRMTVTKNGALVERAGVGTGPYMGGGGRILRFRSFVAPLRMTGSKNGAQAVRAGVGTGPYMGGGAQPAFPLGCCRAQRFLNHHHCRWQCVLIHGGTA